jgi:hypothetical protein
MAARRHIGYQSFEEQAPLVSYILKPRTSNFRWRPKSGPWFWHLFIKKEAWGRGVYVCHLVTRAPKRRAKSQKEGTVKFQVSIQRGLIPSTCWRLMKKREDGSKLTSLIYCRVWRSQPKVYPGKSPVPILFRKVTPSFQLAKGTCTRQFNIQRAQLPPGMSHDELKRCMTGEQRTDLIEGTTPIESSEMPLLGERKGRVYVGIFAIL